MCSVFAFFLVLVAGPVQLDSPLLGQNALHMHAPAVLEITRIALKKITAIFPPNRFSYFFFFLLINTILHANC